MMVQHLFAISINPTTGEVNKTPILTITSLFHVLNNPNPGQIKPLIDLMDIKEGLYIVPTGIDVGEVLMSSVHMPTPFERILMVVDKDNNTVAQSTFIELPGIPKPGLFFPLITNDKYVR